MIKYRGQLRGSHKLFQIYGLYHFFSFFLFFLIKTKFHFMIDLLNLKLCFATDVLTERSGSLSEPGSIFFFQSDLNLLKKFLYFTG